MQAEIAQQAARIAARAPRELEALVGVSSPSGDRHGAEEAIALCRALMPDETRQQRVACSTAGSAPDLIARLQGSGAGRLLLLGHLDTVIGHNDHANLRRDGDRLYGPGTADMKGGVVLALGVARALAEHPERYRELSVLLVTDEEWRTAPFVHAPTFAGYDACLCFEAGEHTEEGEEGVVVVRKGAGTLRVRAIGRPAHSGSAPRDGASALLALAQTALDLAATADPNGPSRLTVVPTILRSGEAINVVPGAGELVLDLRAGDVAAFEPVLAAVPAALGEVRLEPLMERIWPAMNTERETAALLAGAGTKLGRPVRARARGGASDASHFAASIPLTVDGLGPRGGGAHTPQEFVFTDSLCERAEVALALAWQALEPAML
ncbi:MAG: M20/M25/M40 family metallo-hydrolase [Solirubrobacteraceae bacterium]